MNRTQNSRQCDYVQVSCLGHSLALKGFMCKFDWNCTLPILHNWHILSNRYCSYSKWTDRCTSPSMLKIVSDWNHLHIVHYGSIEFQECSFRSLAFIETDVSALFYSWLNAEEFSCFQCKMLDLASQHMTADIRCGFTNHSCWSLHTVFKYAYFLYPSQRNLQCPISWVTKWKSASVAYPKQLV